MRKHLSITLAMLLVLAVTDGCGDDGDNGVPPPTQAPTATANPTEPGATPTPTQPSEASPTTTSTPLAAETPTPGEPGEGRIVFGAIVGEFVSDILVINIDGSDRTNLTNTSDASESQPSWSPDGSMILYRIGDNTIAVMNADGSGQTVVLASDTPIYYPSWSPDASQIVFVADDDFQTQGDNTIDVIDVDGTNRTTILAEKGDYLSPTYSPDGAQVIFVSKVEEVLQLVVMNADGSDMQQITDGEAQNEGSAWSPTGDDIAFTSAERFTTTGGIYLIESNGSDRRLVTEGRGRNVSWNRDGSLLTFDGFSEGINVIRPDGTNLQLVPNTEDGFDPDLD